MANVYFKTFQEVLNYREDRLTFSIVELYKNCSILRSLLKKDTEGFYRKGKSFPLIQDGDIIAVKTNDIFTLMAYNSCDGGTHPVITYDEIISMSSAVYRSDTVTNIIPPIKAVSRKNLFSKDPAFSNNFIKALYSIISMLIEESIGKEHVTDYSYELRDLLLVKKGTAFELQEEARNYLFIEQVKTGIRTPISDEAISDVVNKFEEEYDSLINKILEEVRSATFNTVVEFVCERPCNRYHFSDECGFFFIERGLDTRIYKWEQEKFEKLEEIEDVTGVKIDKIVAPWQSAKYDLF